MLPIPIPIPNPSFNDIKQIIFKDIYQFYKRQTDAYNTISESAVELQNKIKIFEQMVTSIKEYERSPLFVPLIYFDSKLATAKVIIDEFLEKEEKNKILSAARRPIWKIGNTYKIKRLFFASDIHDFFEKTSISIDHEMNVMETRMQLAEQLSTPAAYRFSAYMSDPAFEFWTSICGINRASLSTLWSYFITSYKVKYSEARRWDKETIARMKTIACVDGNDDTITIGGYILLTDEYDFPLDPARQSTLSMPLPAAASWSQFSRNVNNYRSLGNF